MEKHALIEFTKANCPNIYCAHDDIYLHTLSHIGTPMFLMLQVLFLLMQGYIYNILPIYLYIMFEIDIKYVDKLGLGKLILVRGFQNNNHVIQSAI